MADYRHQDQALLNALNKRPPDFAEAERLISEGADINALRHRDESLLSAAITYSDAETVKSIIDFAFEHGLSGKKYRGRHIVAALLFFRYAHLWDFDDPRLIKAFKRLVRLGIHAVRRKKHDEIGYELSHSADYSFMERDFDWSTYSELLAEIIRRARSGADFEGVYSRSQALGKTVRDIKLHLHPAEIAELPAFEHTPDGFTGCSRYRGQLTLEFDDSALLIQDGFQPMVIPLGDLPEENLSAVSVAEHFKPLIGQTVKAFGYPYFKLPHWGDELQCLAKFDVGLSNDTVLHINYFFEKCAAGTGHCFNTIELCSGQARDDASL